MDLRGKERTFAQSGSSFTVYLDYYRVGYRAHITPMLSAGTVCYRVQYGNVLPVSSVEEIYIYPITSKMTGKMQWQQKLKQRNGIPLDPVFIEELGRKIIAHSP